MMDQIYVKQNEERCLEFLFAQKMSYNRADIYDYAGWISTLILLVCSIVFQLTELDAKYTLLIEVILTILVVLFDKQKNRYVKRGADLKSIIDSELFGMICDVNKEWYVDYAVALKNKMPQKYAEQISHTGNDKTEGVKDWYTFFDSANHLKVIFSCQKENLWWNEKLSRVYNKIVLGLVITGVMLLVIPIIAFKISFSIVILLVISVLLEKSIETIVQYKRYVKAMDKAQGQIELIEECEDMLNINALSKLQKEVIAVRNSGYLIPDWLHKIRSISLHKAKKEINDRLAS